MVYNVTDNVIAYGALQQNCQDICADDDSFHFAILELVRQKLCTVTVGSDREQVGNKDAWFLEYFIIVYGFLF